MNKVEIILFDINNTSIREHLTPDEREFINNKISQVKKETCYNSICIKCLIDVFIKYKQWKEENEIELKPFILLRRSLTDINSYSGKSKPWVNFTAGSFNMEPIIGDCQSLFIGLVDNSLSPLYINDISSHPDEKRGFN